MRRPKIATTPPRLTALAGRASPQGSKNFGGLNKGIDMPNKAKAKGADMSPFGGMPTQNFCSGGKVTSTRKM